MKILLPIGLSVALSAQDVLWERNGQANSHLRHDYAKFIGDVDGDDCDDLVTRIFQWGGPVIFLQRLEILSGRSGRTLRTLPLPLGNDIQFDDWGGAGDMDGDRIDDYLFSFHENQTPFHDYVEVHSGRDDALIFRLVNPSQLIYPPRTDVLAGRDVTGDGRSDLVIRSGVSAAEAIVSAFDHTGRRLYRHVGSWAGRSYTVGSGQAGNVLGWVGDLDGDGGSDFTLGSYDASVGRYVALVLSGRTGLVLQTGVSASPSAGIGWCADGCGDMDQDGAPDFCAGTSLTGGDIQVFSGRTGQTIRTWNVAGAVVRSGGFDFDRDGISDVIFERGGAGGGTFVASGRDGGPVLAVLGCTQAGGTSRQCSYATDTSVIEVGRPRPGNPFPVFLFAEPAYGTWVVQGSGTVYLGRLRMYCGTPPGVEPYGTSCLGTLTSRLQMGIRDLQGGGVRLHLTHAPPGAHAALLLGFSRTNWSGVALPLALAPLGLSDCSLFTSLDLFAKTWTGVTGMDRGFASIDLPLPLSPPGREWFTLHGQWLVLDPASGGTAMSDAVLWRH